MSFIPKTAAERRFLQASDWTISKAWRRGSADLRRGEIAIAAAEFLGLVRQYLRGSQYELAFGTLETVRQYKKWLSKDDRDSVIRIVGFLLTEMDESQDLTNIARKLSKDEAVRIISEFCPSKEELKNTLNGLGTSARSSCLTELLGAKKTILFNEQIEHIGNMLQVVLLAKSIPDVRAELQIWVNTLKSEVSAVIANVSSLQINSSVTIAELSKLRFFVEISKIRSDNVEMDACSNELDNFIRNSLREYCNSFGDDKSKFSLRAYEGTDFSYALLLQNGIDERVEKAVTRHLVTISSLCVYSGEPDAAIKEIKSLIQIIHASDFNTGLDKYCQKQLAVWETQFSYKEPDIATVFYPDLIRLAQANFSFKQTELGQLLLSKVLDCFSAESSGIEFVNKIWQNTNDLLIDFWHDSGEKFVIPLAMLTEYYVGQSKIRLENINKKYATTVSRLEIKAGKDNACKFVESVIKARESVHGGSHAYLRSLLNRNNDSGTFVWNKCVE